MRSQVNVAGKNIRADARSGFTFVELIVALMLGAIVMTAAIKYLITEFQTLSTHDIRDTVARNGRYIGISLRRDLQRAGIGIETTTTFGTADAWPGDYGDTLVVLFVPYVPTLAPPHDIVPPDGTENPLPPSSVCGLQCIEVTKDAVAPLDLGIGDLTRLQVLGSRRLALVRSLNVTSDTSVELLFTTADTLLRQPAGMDLLSLDRFGTYVQELSPISYYLDENEQLIRAVRLNLDGSPAGQVLAFGVEEFEVTLVFVDGDEWQQANAVDTDDSNDFDDVVAVKIRVTVKADRVHPKVNGGELLRRTFEWTIAPRNLRYEKDRL